MNLYYKMYVGDKDNGCYTLFFEDDKIRAERAFEKRLHENIIKTKYAELLVTDLDDDEMDDYYIEKAFYRKSTIILGQEVVGVGKTEYINCHE